MRHRRSNAPARGMPGERTRTAGWPRQTAQDRGHHPSPDVGIVLAADCGTGSDREGEPGNREQLMCRKITPQRGQFKRKGTATDARSRDEVQGGGETLESAGEGGVLLDGPRQEPEAAAGREAALACARAGPCPASNPDAQSAPSLRCGEHGPRWPARLGVTGGVGRRYAPGLATVVARDGPAACRGTG